MIWEKDGKEYKFEQITGEPPFVGVDPSCLPTNIEDIPPRIDERGTGMSICDAEATGLGFEITLGLNGLHTIRLLGNESPITGYRQGE